MDFLTLLFGNLVSVAVAYGAYRLYTMYHEYLKLQQLYKCAQFLTAYAGVIGTIITVDRVQRFFNMSQCNTNYLREVASEVNREMFDMKNTLKDIKNMKNEDDVLKDLKNGLRPFKIPQDEPKLPKREHLPNLERLADDQLPVH